MIHLLLLFLATTHVANAMAKDAIVVGAGPSGLAAALMLSQRHNYQVTLLEAAQRIDAFDPSRAYPFLIRERGQKLTKLFPEIQASLQANAIKTEGPTKLVSIPADPKEILDTEPKTISVFRASGSSFWIRRHEFSRLLLDAVQADPNITLKTACKCKSLAAAPGESIELTTEEGDGKSIVTRTYKTNLVVGSDGINSVVRENLAKDNAFAGWKNARPKGFRIKKWMSPASGLKFKVSHYIIHLTTATFPLSYSQSRHRRCRSIPKPKFQ